MKPRRENGATFVSPMKSGVCRGSALMAGFLKDWLGMRIQQAIAAKHKSPACEDLRDALRSSAQSGLPKKQGRRRSMTPVRPCPARTLKSACAAR